MVLGFSKIIKNFTIILLTMVAVAGLQQCKPININENEEEQNVTNTRCCCDVMKEVFRHCFKSCKQKQSKNKSRLKRSKLYKNYNANQLFISYVDILANKDSDMDKEIKEISDSMDLSLYEI